MIKIKLLITTSLLMLLIPILDKGIRLSPNPILNQQGITIKAANEISQIIKPVEATNQQVESSQTRLSKGENNQTKQAGFCLNVPILMYHHIQPQSIATKKWQANFTVDNSIFDNQMAYLASSGYTTVSLDQLALALTSHQALPSKSIVLTFDDGYEDIYTYAYPVIKKYQLKTNLMIPTGLIENSDYLSWSQLKEMFSSGQVFVYNHTWSHRNLGSASIDTISQEVLTANNQLQANLGKTVDIFAYPYGSENNTVIKFLQSNGFIAAVSTVPGQTQCDSFIMTLHRTRIGNSPLSSYGI